MVSLADPELRLPAAIPTASAASHLILLTREDAFSAVLAAAPFAKLQITVQNANPEIQPTMEQFA
jgi:hypothetical protein